MNSAAAEEPPTWLPDLWILPPAGSQLGGPESWGGGVMNRNQGVTTALSFHVAKSGRGPVLERLSPRVLTPRPYSLPHP